MRLKEVQINKTEKMVYCLDENYEVMHKAEISTDFYEGENDAGQPRGNAADGVYRETVWADIDYPGEDDLSAAFGWAYLNIDGRGRAIHGGGSNLGWDGAMQAIQPLLPTYGCFRMRNVDIFWICYYWRDAVAEGLNPCVHVVS